MKDARLQLGEGVSLGIRGLEGFPHLPTFALQIQGQKGAIPLPCCITRGGQLRAHPGGTKLPYIT